jgi:PAS domain S-box-containing protein
MTQPIRVLLVDDEPDFPETAATFLEREDDRLEVTPAASARAGLDHLEASAFDCVVSDYAMPEMDGLAFLEAVREEHPDLPFVLFTARGSEDVASEAITAGVSDYYQRDRHGDEDYAVLANRVTNLVERYRAEREADRTRSHLQAITESSADAIVTVDEDSTIRFANAAVRDLFGYEPDELLGERLTVLMPGRYRQEHLDAMERYVETGHRRLNWSNVEFSGRRADGEEIPLSVSFGEFEHDGDRRFVGIVRDVSEHKQVEADLREREARFRQLAENIREVVWMADPGKQELFYVNPAYEDVWGRSVESLYEDPASFLEAVHPDDRDRVEVASTQQLEGGYDEEYRIVRPDGQVRWVRDRAIPIRDDDGEVYRIVGIASDVTERKEETRRLETLISNLPGIVYRCRNEPGWPMDFVRGECEAITGYPSERLESGDLVWGEDVIHADDRAETWETVQEAFETGEQFEVTYRIVTADGAVKWMWERGRIVTTHAGERVLEGFISDITDRRERERELERVERRYDSIFHDPNILAALLDTDGTVLDINETAMEYVDAPADAALGTPLWETPWYDQADVDQTTVRDSIERAAEGVYVEFQREFARPDGTSYSLEGVFRPVRDDDGSVQSIVLSVRDVTDRKRRQERLRQYELAVESASEMLAAIDDDFEYLFANRAYRDYYDLDQERLRETSVPENLGEEAFETTRPYLERAFEGETTRYRTTRSRPDEPTRVFEVQFAPLEDDDGTVQGVVATMRDLTKQRERETQLVSLDRMLRHNLHNELNVVLGYADMIEREADDQLAEYGSTIATATRRVLDQADKEREIVELLTDQSPPQRLDLSGVLEAMVDRLEESHPDAEIALDLPEQLRIVAIPEISRAIEELVINAIDHCDEDVPDVTIRARRRDGTVEVSVRDNGPGMPSQERRVVGEDSPIDPLVHSSGMGLWLVKRIANRAGGTVRFEENEPEGSVVTLVIPGGAAD